jgi:ASC-1-like (ASCH) protein
METTNDQRLRGLEYISEIRGVVNSRRSFIEETLLDKFMVIEPQVKQEMMWINESQPLKISFSPNKPEVKTIEVKIDNWKKVLNYDREKSLTLFNKLLTNFGLKPDKHTINWFQEELIEIVKSYEKEYGVRLSNSMRKKIGTVIAQIAFDRLYWEP